MSRQSARRSAAELGGLVGYPGGCDARDWTRHLADGHAREQWGRYLVDVRPEGLSTSPIGATRPPGSQARVKQVAKFMAA